MEQARVGKPFVEQCLFYSIKLEPCKMTDLTEISERNDYTEPVLVFIYSIFVIWSIRYYAHDYASLKIFDWNSLVWIYEGNILSHYS